MKSPRLHKCNKYQNKNLAQILFSPHPVRTITIQQPSNMTYVNGFGWLECQTFGKDLYAEDIYESSNRVSTLE